MAINVQQKDNDTFDVTVNESSTTQHTVTVTDAYYDKLTNGSVEKKDLVHESFVFLLAREPNTAILSQFELNVIQRYFS